MGNYSLNNFLNVENHLWEVRREQEEKQLFPFSKHIATQRTELQNFQMGFPCDGKSLFVFGIPPESAHQ